MGVPNTFGNATTAIPLTQLDANFNTTATLGNAAIGLGNTTTTVGNLTLQNVTITSGSIPNTTITGGNVTIGNTTIGLGNTATSIGNVSLSNATITTINEPSNVTATAANSTINFDVLNNAVQYFTSNAAGNWTVNFRGTSSVTFNNAFANNTSISCTLMATQGATPYYNSAITIDGNAVTPKWQGGTAPSSGNASGVDSYSYVIVKTGSNTYTVFASQTQFK
jgi:hypothetical protein